MIYLATVTHDLRTNTLEATWLEETANELRRVKCHNYSPSQSEMFINDINDADISQRYLDSAGWTPEFCAEFTAEEVRLAEEAQALADAEAEKQKEAAQAEFDAAVARQVAIMQAAQALVTQSQG